MAEWFLFNMLFITLMITCFITNWDSVLVRKFILALDWACKSYRVEHEKLAARRRSRLNAESPHHTNSSMMVMTSTADCLSSPTLDSTNATSCTASAADEEAAVNEDVEREGVLGEHTATNGRDGGSQDVVNVDSIVISDSRAPASASARKNEGLPDGPRREQTTVSIVDAALLLENEEDKSFYRMVWADKPLETRIDYISLVSFLTAYIVIASQMLLRLNWTQQAQGRNV